MVPLAFRSRAFECWFYGSIDIRAKSSASALTYIWTNVEMLPCIFACVCVHGIVSICGTELHRSLGSHIDFTSSYQNTNIVKTYECAHTCFHELELGSGLVSVFVRECVCVFLRNSIDHGTNSQRVGNNDDDTT